MIKVLQIGMTRNIGGLETYLMQQFNHLDYNKVKYDFVNITGEYDIAFSDEIKSKGSKIYNVISRHSNPLLHYYQWIKILFENKGKYAAIVLNSNSLEYVFPIFIAKIFKIPVRIMHSHNTSWEHKIGFGRKCLLKINRILLNFSVTDYWACSKAAGIWMFGENKSFRIVHNAIEVQKYKYNSVKRNEIRKILKLKGKYVVGHVGRFTYQKNHDFLIDIFKEVSDIEPNAVLLLVGDAVGDLSYINNIKDKVKKLKIEDKVKFLGMRKDVPEIMQAMDCFVLPSHFEGLPLVGIEAQAAGLKCFFSDVITEEVGITNLSQFISLKDSAKKWAKKIIENKDYIREDTSNKIKNAGYEIRKETEKVEDFFLNIKFNDRNLVK